MSLCAICLEPPAGLNRVGGLDVCDSCFQGGASSSVPLRGWGLKARSWVVRMKDANIYYCEVLGSIPTALPLKATFRMKEGLYAFLGMFAGLRVGDPLFDKMVYVSTGSKALTSEFFKSDGAQSAVMDLVGEQAIIVVNGGQVRVTAWSTETGPAETRIEAETAVILAHLEAFAKDFGPQMKGASA